MAGVYIIFQYVDSLVNRTSPIYFPCYCFDLFLIMRLFLHVPRLLKKNLNAEGKSFPAVVLGVLGEQLLHHCIQCQHQMQLFECKVKERSQKACDCEVKKPLKVFFFANICFCFILIKEEIAKRNPSTQTFLSLESQAKTSRQLLWHWSIVWGLFFNQGSMKTTKT